MTEVARDAFLEVCADVDTLVADVGQRLLVKRTYFERLVRADIADRLRVAADRHDSDIGAFYEAVGRFFTVVPPLILASTDAHLRHVLRPAAYRYSRLPTGARTSFWRMIRPILAGDPRSSRQLGGNSVFALVVWLARRWPTSSGEAAAGAVLFPISLAARLVRRLGVA